MVVAAVVEHWELMPGALGSISSDCHLLTFLCYHAEHAMYTIVTLTG